MGSSPLKQHRQFFSISCWTQDLHPATDSKEPEFCQIQKKNAFNTRREDHPRIRRMIFDGCPCRHSCPGIDRPGRRLWVVPKRDAGDGKHAGHGVNANRVHERMQSRTGQENGSVQNRYAVPCCRLSWFLKSSRNRAISLSVSRFMIPLHRTRNSGTSFISSPDRISGTSCEV